MNRFFPLKFIVFPFIYVRICCESGKVRISLKFNRDELFRSIDEYKKKYPEEDKVPRPKYWSGWNLNPYEIEFWLQRENRIHERLKYKKKENDSWERFLLNP